MNLIAAFVSHRPVSASSLVSSVKDRLARAKAVVALISVRRNSALDTPMKTALLVATEIIDDAAMTITFLIGHILGDDVVAGANGHLVRAKALISLVQGDDEAGDEVGLVLDLAVSCLAGALGELGEHRA